MKVGVTVGMGEVSKSAGQFVLGAALVALPACVVDDPSDWYARQYGCDPISVQPTEPSRYVVDGCAGLVRYYCARGTCIPIEDKEGDATAKSESASDEGTKRASQHDAKEKERGVDISVIVRLEQGIALMLQAHASRESRRVHGKLVGGAGYFEELDECSLQWMINGQRMKSPESKFESDGRLSALSAELPPHFVEELGAAEQIGLRACNRRFRLNPAQVYEVREFIAGYEDELAWEGIPSDSTAGLVTPSGGWPDWEPLDTMPTASQGPSLGADALFKQLSASVFSVEAILSDGISQGSAVAIDDEQLLTNCHVVAGARKITLRQHKGEWVAGLRRADPESDRCVLRVKGTKLKPIGGVRAYDSLNVGEPLFTLGSPAGLELSIADGILSGLRQREQGLPFVQTTAPISPGSSGGGLFDARGNLVGITTLVLTGRERLNQSLNFAIPADSYFEK